LRPGGYGRVRLSIRTQPGALLVPQRAITELQGSYQVAVVDGDNKVSIRPVTVGDRVGTLWIVTDGLKAGERVIVEGLLKVRDGTVVNAGAAKAPQRGGGGVEVLHQSPHRRHRDLAAHGHRRRDLRWHPAGVAVPV